MIVLLFFMSLKFEMIIHKTNPNWQENSPGSQPIFFPPRERHDAT